MYLHIGQNEIIPDKRIIGIFDLENTSISKITKEFLARSEKGGLVVNVSYELPKSFVICGRGRRDPKVYITQISSATLKKRAGFVDGLANIEHG